MIQLYYIPVCSKSRTALDLLKESGLPYEIRDYISSPPSRSELEDLLEALQRPVLDLIRIKEASAAEMAQTHPSQEEWLAWLEKNPEAMQRPIARYGNRAWIVRPGDKIQEVIDLYRAEHQV